MKTEGVWELMLRRMLGRERRSYIYSYELNNLLSSPNIGRVR
jgi:hypothetical protein